MRFHLVCVNVGFAFEHEYCSNLIAGVKANTTHDFDTTVIVDKHTRGKLKGLDAKLVNDVFLEGPAPANGRNWYWWAKLNIFRQLWDDHEKVLYLDLDTVVQGDLDGLLALEGFRMLNWERKFYPYGSGVMLFRAGGWPALADFDIKKRDVYRKKGDQQYIHQSVSDATMGMQPFPITTDIACSYKRHWRKDLHKEAPIVAFHGKPRPHQLGNDHPLKILWNR